MRKNVSGRQLGRAKNQRQALFKGLICSLIDKGGIVTSLAKAKAVRGEAEKLITKAKKKTLAGRRTIFRFLNNRALVNRLVEGIAPILQERKSGYLRIVRIGLRRGDRAALVKLEFDDDVSNIAQKPEPAPVEGEEDDKTNKKVKN